VLILEALSAVIFAPEKVAVLDPVPPLATANTPLEMFPAFKLVMLAPEKVAVLDPVPPLAMGTIGSLAVEIVPVDKLEAFRFVILAPEKVAVLEPVPPLAIGTTGITEVGIVPVDKAEALIPVVVAVVTTVPVSSGSVSVLFVLVAGGTMDTVPVPLVVRTSIWLTPMVPFAIS
jgi:hypothetical protein